MITELSANGTIARYLSYSTKPIKAVEDRRVLSFMRLGKDTFRQLEYHINEPVIRWA